MKHLGLVMKKHIAKVLRILTASQRLANELLHAQQRIQSIEQRLAFLSAELSEVKTVGEATAAGMTAADSRLATHSKSLLALSTSMEPLRKHKLPDPLNQLDSLHPHRHVWTEVLSALSNELPNISAESCVIELNCSFGKATSWVTNQGAKYIGLDSSHVLIQSARKLEHTPLAEFYLLSSESLSRLEGAADMSILLCDPDQWSLSDLLTSLHFSSKYLKVGGALSVVMLQELATIDKLPVSVVEASQQEGFGSVRLQEFSTEAGLVTILSASLSDQAK